MHNTCNSLSTAKMNGLNTSERYGKGRLDQPNVCIGLQCARMISMYEHIHRNERLNVYPPWYCN